MHILLTGGGTGGHIQPNLALVSATVRSKKNIRFSYMGSKKGPEKALASTHKISFEAVETGKFRRYFSLKNITDGVRVLIGVRQARRKLKTIRPDLVFSTGGFVSFPVLWAAWRLGIPTVLYDLDAMPNLTTRFFAPKATRVLTSFQESAEALEKRGVKAEVVGPLLRPEIMEGSKARGLEWARFSGKRPILLVMGGSQGAQELNEAVLKCRVALEKDWDVVHLTGEGKGEFVSTPHYKSVDSVGSALSDIYAMTSAALTRGGANSLAELEAWNIPALIWPLGLNSSRGDQWVNASALIRRGAPFSVIKNSGHIVQELRALQELKKPTQRHQNPLKTAERILDILIKTAC